MTRKSLFSTETSHEQEEIPVSPDEADWGFLSESASERLGLFSPDYAPASWDEDGTGGWFKVGKGGA